MTMTAWTAMMTTRVLKLTSNTPVRSEKKHQALGRQSGVAWGTQSSSLIWHQALSGGLEHYPRHAVRVGVGSRPPVLHVTSSILLCITRNADGGTTVCNAELESVN